MGGARSRAIGDRPPLVSRGFYDALANGRSFARAFNEGGTALKLKGFDDFQVKMITVQQIAANP
jgi:hypothetical protein